MSPNAKHTPGPWKLETVKTACGICHKIGEFRRHPSSYHGEPNYACVYDDHPGGPVSEELLANAQLIARAPDLLADLTRLVDLINLEGPAMHAWKEVSAICEKYSQEDAP